MSDVARPPGDEPANPADLWSAWLRAWGIRAPLSGDVTQDIETSLIRRLSEQLGFINVSLSSAGDPQLERRIVEDVASYGRQLSRVLDVLHVLIRHALPDDLSPDDRHAVEELEALQTDIEAVKTRETVGRVERLVEDIERLKRDPGAERDALRRLRQALGDD
jgi:hypothetical protein